VTGKVVEVESTSLLGLILFEIGLINGVFDLDLSLLLDLVMVNHEGLTVIGSVVKSRLGNGGGIWLLEADESEVSVSSFFELNVLDGSELLEEVLKFLLWPLVWEVLDIEVASLLGGLVSESISLLFDLSIGLFHGVSNVELEFICHFFSRESINSFLGAFWTVLFVVTFGIVIADESVLTDWVLHGDKRFDISKSLEHFFDLIIGVGKWDVLDVDIVNELSELSSIFWLEFHGDDFIIFLRESDGLGSRSLILEADESVSS